jgi:site-specific recombinase XerD
MSGIARISAQPLWVHNRPAETVRTYRADLVRFTTWAQKPLAALTLTGLAGFWDPLEGLAPATRARMLPAGRSLLSFGRRIGYLPFDVGRPFPIPALPNPLAERILPEATV